MAEAPAPPLGQVETGRHVPAQDWHPCRLRASRKGGTRVITIEKRTEPKDKGILASAASEASASTSRPNKINSLGKNRTDAEQALTDAPRTPAAKTASAFKPLIHHNTDAADAADADLPLCGGGPVCAHCGEPGAEPWDWEGGKVPLHRHCADAWADLSANRRLRVVARSS